jgi:hypothetical protein
VADTKISGLPAVTSVADTDELVLASSGASKKVTAKNLRTSMGGIVTGTVAPTALVGTIGDLYLDTNSKLLYQFRTGAPPDWAVVGSVTVAADRIWSVKGDLVAATGSNNSVRVPVGSNNQVLTADSAFPSGVKWATPVAAPAAPAPQARTHNLLGWAYEPSSVTTTLAPTAGQATLVKVFMPDGGTIGKACVVVGVLGGTITNAFLGVYNAAGTLIGKTADQSAAWTTTGFKNPAVTAEAGQSLAITGGPDAFVFVAILVGAATTIPAFLRGSGTGAFANLNLAAADGYRYGTSGSGLTALTSTITPTALGLAIAYWAGVST